MNPRQAAAVAFAAVLAAVGVEAICRHLDHFAIGSIALRPTASEPIPLAGSDGPDRRYLAGVRRADGVSLDWYEERPPAVPRIAMTPELRRRGAQYPQDLFAPFFEWNLAFLQQQTCSGQRAMTMGSLEDFYYFESLDSSPYPAYRHLRHISPPFWFVTNSFGWRGPDVPLAKAPDTIRIAFVGASTTIDKYDYPFSHPELVGYWLNRWASARRLPYRFEVINAGRTGIDTRSIAAIVQQELLPVEPDLVVFYEGANQFRPVEMLRGARPDSDAARSRPSPRLATAARYSALARRMSNAIARAQAGNGSEPLKPPTTIAWPDGVDEVDPALDDRLPMDLPQVVRDLDTMRTSLSSIGSELVVSSFVWMVWDRMRLDPDSDLTLFDYLNGAYWPATYAEMRRIADFQNRVFRKYAAVHGLPFVDIAAEYPRDASLAADGVHLRYPGLALQGWMFLQHLISIVEARIADGRLPKRQHRAVAAHPAFAQPSPRLVTLAALRGRCR